MTVMSRVELAKIGARVRLEELNKERDTLLDFLGYPDDLKSQVAENKKKKSPYTKNKPHWLQTKAGKEKMRKIQLARKKNGK